LAAAVPACNAISGNGSRAAEGTEGDSFEATTSLGVPADAIATAKTLLVWLWQPVAWGALARRRHDSNKPCGIATTSGVTDAALAHEAHGQPSGNTTSRFIISRAIKPFQMLGRLHAALDCSSASQSSRLLHDGWNG
jgi:hypothetical protein